MVQTIRPQNLNLRSYIHSFNLCSLDWGEIIQAGNSLKGIQNGLVAIWFCKGDPFQISLDGLTFYQAKGAFVIGLTQHFTLFKGQGTTEALIINMYPWAINLLLGLPPIELSHQLIRVEDCFPKALLDKFSALDADLFNPCFLEKLESLLLPELNPQNKLQIWIPYAHRVLESGKEVIQVDELAHRTGISRQHFRRLFKEHVGVTPKQFAQISKIRRSVDDKWHNTDKLLTQLAHDHDFHDQAHFIHLFKKLTGECPHAFFQQKHMVDLHLGD